jgi:flagellar hook-length control protein FliK
MTMNAVLSSSTALANLFALAGQGQVPEADGAPFSALLMQDTAPKTQESVAKVQGTVGQAPEDAETDSETALPPGIARLIGLPVTPRGKGKGAGGDPETAGPKMELTGEAPAETPAETQTGDPVYELVAEVRSDAPEVVPTPQPVVILAAVPVAQAAVVTVQENGETNTAKAVSNTASNIKPELSNTPSNTQADAPNTPTTPATPVLATEIARLFGALVRQDARGTVTPALPEAAAAPAVPSTAVQAAQVAADPLAPAVAVDGDAPVRPDKPVGDIAIVAPAAPDAPVPASSTPRVDVIVQATTPAIPTAQTATPQPMVNASETMIDHHLDVARDGEWLDRLARDIAGFATENGRLRFQLNPEHLGTLRVELANGGEGTSVRFTADTDAARALIADAQPRLVAEAKAHGLKIAETHVDLGGQQQMAGQQQQQPRQQAADAQPAWVRTGQSRQGEAAPEESGQGRDRYA